MRALAAEKLPALGITAQAEEIARAWRGYRMPRAATEVAPVRSVDKIAVGSGKRGPVTQQIQQRFLDIVHGRVEDSHGWLTYVRAERASGRK